MWGDKTGIPWSGGFLAGDMMYKLAYKMVMALSGVNGGSGIVWVGWRSVVR